MAAKPAGPLLAQVPARAAPPHEECQHPGWLQPFFVLVGLRRHHIPDSGFCLSRRVLTPICYAGYTTANNIQSSCANVKSIFGRIFLKIFVGAAAVILHWSTETNKGQ